MHISSIDVFIIVAYFIATISFGLWFGRKKIHTGEGLFLADREATWPLIGASLFSANISSEQFVGQAGLAYLIGLTAGAFQLVGAMCFTFLAVFFVDVYLGMRLQTAPEFFERRYNRGARRFVAGINIVMILTANIAAALYAGATVITGLMGWHTRLQFDMAVLVTALAAGLYTVTGGLRSVLWVDLLQATVLVAGGAITLVVAVTHAGGVLVVLHSHTALGKDAWSVILPWYKPYGWLPMLTGAVILGVHAHCTDHDYVQRALAGRNVFHAKMGAIFAAFLKIVALFVVAAPGVVAAKLMPGLTHADQAYTRLVAGYVPSGMAGLVLAGLLAAILGTVAAGLSASSAMVVYDFIVSVRPELSNRLKVRIGRWVMVLVLIVCMMGAPSIRHFPGLFDYLVRLWSLLAPAVFVCAVFGIFSQRANGRGAIATLTLGSVLGGVAFWMLSDNRLMGCFPAYLRSPLNIGFVITVICALVMIAFSHREPLEQRAGMALSVWRFRKAGASMTLPEKRIYRATLICLIFLWCSVAFIFSPWGVARQ